ncbi:MAG: ADP-ribosylglycohydrolase family protein [Firmicutes bacterium]|nr:ADP-ribosylglycohydrolase family protein [Bacillota bacterium]
MFGAIIGDIVGSPYEFDHNNVKHKDFPLFENLKNGRGGYTDDSVLTLAVYRAIQETENAADPRNKELLLANLTENMQSFGLQFPNAGYGISFGEWMQQKEPKPYGSFGNGSAMRVSAAGWMFDDLESVRYVARCTAAVTHNHPEGIKGAESVAAAIFLARTGGTKGEIKAYIELEFGYDLSRSCDEIRPGYHHVETCQETVPEAFAAFFEGTSFEDVLRTAVSLGGDSDTLAAIAGSMAEAYYGINEDWKKVAFNYLPRNLTQILRDFDYRYGVFPEAEENPVHAAIRFAEEAHRGQKRKGTEIAYITHPMEVLQILISMGAEWELQMAGVLHDTVEDTEVTLEQIRQKFGDRVAQLVACHTENKSLSWRERKQNTLDELRTAERDVKLLILADTVSNLRSMLYDYRLLGEDLWKRFNASKEEQLWYNSEMQDLMAEFREDEKVRIVYWELVALFKDLFADYYLDEENHVLYQVCGSDSWKMTWGDSPWEPLGEPIPAGTVKLPRLKAERLEDIWRWEGRDFTLDGNELLEDAMTNYYIRDSAEAFEAAEQALLRRFLEGGHLILAVENVEEDGVLKHKLRTISHALTEEEQQEAERKERENVVPLFTSKEELYKGPNTDALSIEIDAAVNLVLQDEELDGMVINPWGIPWFLGREFLKKLFETMEKLQIVIE